VLQSEGYRTTTVKLAIDATGLIRHTQTAVRFADGGSVDIDVTFSAFGCSTIVQRPDGPWIVPAPGGACA